MTQNLNSYRSTHSSRSKNLPLSRRRQLATVVAFTVAGASFLGAFLAPGAGAQTDSSDTPAMEAPVVEAPAVEIPPLTPPADPITEAPLDIPPTATPIETDVPVIVRLSTDTTAAELADDLATAGGDITQEYDRVFPGFAADLSDEQIDWLVTQPGVVSVEADPTLFALGRERTDLSTATTESGTNNLNLWLLVGAVIAAAVGVAMIGAGRRKGVLAIASLAFIAAACGPEAAPPPTTTPPTTTPPTTTPPTTTPAPVAPAAICRATVGTNRWGLDRIDQAGPWGVNDGQQNCLTNSGAGVDAYIFDTGILCTHTQFVNGGVSRAICDPQFDEISAHTSSVDCHGHGTHTAGTVAGKDYGVAPGATVYAVRVLSCYGSGSTSGIIAAINNVITHHTTRSAVANFSLGGGASASFDAAIQALVADGISVSVSAGNSNADACNQSPARATNAITVGSTDIYDVRSSFSNWGACVDIMAPGSSILSAYYTSDTAAALMSGTSMSSPHVAGCAARYLAKFPGATPAQVTTGLVAAATNNVLSDSFGSMTPLPAGTPNKLLYCDPSW